jgi:DNA-directed RNA polymerase specialized sigma24 family protein
MLNTYAFSKVGDSALGEDLVQKTFAKTWARLVSGGKVDLMKAFLYHVLNDLIVDEYRKHKTTSLDPMLRKGFAPSNNDYARFFDILDGKKAILLIKQLPPIYQKIMTMRYVQDFSISAMAHITHQSRNTVTIQAFRGLEKLRNLYSNPTYYSFPTTKNRHRWSVS